MSNPAASNSDKPRQEEENHHQLSFSSLPDDIVLNCLARIPRKYDQIVSCLSKSINSLLQSPELDRLRSPFLKNSLYVGVLGNHSWFCLSRTEKTTTSNDYQLVPIPIPYHTCMYFSSAAVVGSKMYFISRHELLDHIHSYNRRSKKFWILDLKSGELREGPSMKVARYAPLSEVVDGKIYVIGGSKKQVQVEVFDPKTQRWEFATEEVVQCQAPFSASSLEGKIYVVDYGGKQWVYDPRKGLSKEVLTKKKRIRRKEKLEGFNKNGFVKCVCVVENVLCGFFRRSGLMWFDSKLSDWRSLVIGNDVKTVLMGRVTCRSYKMAEYEGKLAFFWSRREIAPSVNSNIGCTLITLDRVGEDICGKMEWSGIVASLPRRECTFMHCLLVSD